MRTSRQTRRPLRFTVTDLKLRVCVVNVFLFADPTVITDVSPLYGPTTGNTLVTITANSLLNSGTLRCKFGTVSPVYSTATWTSSTTAECRSVARTAGPYAVQLAVNFVDFSASYGTNFQYYTPPTVSSLLLSKQLLGTFCCVRLISLYHILTCVQPVARPSLSLVPVLARASVHCSASLALQLWPRRLHSRRVWLVWRPRRLWAVR